MDGSRGRNVSKWFGGQQWLNPEEVSDLWVAVMGEGPSESTVRRRCDNGALASMGIELNDDRQYVNKMSLLRYLLDLGQAIVEHAVREIAAEEELARHRKDGVEP